MTSLPKRDKYADNSKIAYQNLEQALAPWRISEEREIASGIEYGKDFIVSVVDNDNNVTSLEFAVQSKVISSSNKRGTSDIWDALAVRTLNYLRDLTQPVLIHYFDSSLKIGYVRWLDEWFDSPDCPKDWNTKKKVKFSIGRSNLLDEKMKEKILRVLQNKASRQSVLRNAESLERRFGSQAKVEIHLEPDSNDEIQVKWLEPLQVILAAEDKDTLRESAITSTPQELKHSYTVQGDHDFSDFVIGKTLVNVKGLKLDLHWLVEWKDAHGMLVHKSSFLDVYSIDLVDTRLLVAKDARNGLIYIADFKNQTTEIRFDSQARNTTPEDNTVHFVNLYENLRAAKSFTLTMPETGEATTQQLQDFLPKLPANLYFTSSLIRALHAIKEETDVEIPVPQTFSKQDLGLAQELASIVRIGMSKHVKLPNFLLKDDIQFHLEVDKTEFEEYRKHENDEVEVPGLRVAPTLFGQVIDLGETTFRVKNFRIEQVDDIEPSADDRERVLITYDFDRQEFLTIFPRFYKDTSPL
jgi:hypothetical protein